MSEAPATCAARRSGLLTGAALLLVGCIAAWLALGFDTESRAFPLGLSILLALSGAGIVTQSQLGLPGAAPRTAGQASVASAVILLAAWGLAFASGLGFVLPTFLLQAGLLWTGGVRSARRLLPLAMAITIAAWLLFVFVLDVPLPSSLLPDALHRF